MCKFDLNTARDLQLLECCNNTCDCYVITSSTSQDNKLICVKGQYKQPVIRHIMYLTTWSLAGCIRSVSLVADKVLAEGDDVVLSVVLFDVPFAVNQQLNSHTKIQQNTYLSGWLLENHLGVLHQLKVFQGICGRVLQEVYPMTDGLCVLPRAV